MNGVPHDVELHNTYLFYNHMHAQLNAATVRHYITEIAVLY